MNVLCNLATKKIESFARWDDIIFDPATHVVLNIDYTPDVENERLNAQGTGLRNATPAELSGVLNDRKDAQVAAEFTPAMEALVLALDPVTGAAAIAQAKATRRAEL